MGTTIAGLLFKNINTWKKYSVVFLFLVAELNAFFQSLCLILFAECLDFLVLNGELRACTIYCKSSHKTVRISIRWLIAEENVINHLCMYFWGISLSYFSNQVFWSMLPVPDFCVLYVRFWMSSALIHRVLPLARIISSAWIFSMTNPLLNSFCQQHLSALKHQVTTMAFWKPRSFALALQVGLAVFYLGPFLPSGCSSTINISLAIVSKLSLH